MSPLKRRDDWQTRLNTFFADHILEPFAYGKFDCCLFVCGAVRAMTDVDLAEPFRGQYASLRASMRAIKNYTGGRECTVEAVAEAVTRRYRMPEVEVAFAQRGDVVYLPIGDLIGIVGFKGAAVVLTQERGLWRIPITEAQRAWRV